MPPNGLPYRPAFLAAAGAVAAGGIAAIAAVDTGQLAAFVVAMVFFVAAFAILTVLAFIPADKFANAPDEVPVGVIAARVPAATEGHHLLSAPRQPGAGGRRIALRAAASLLPAEIREDYQEEWQRWLSDRQAEGAPWHWRMAELFSLIKGAVVLAVILRRGRRRAVE